jgi:hypothetical protein
MREPSGVGSIDGVNMHCFDVGLAATAELNTNATQELRNNIALVS